MLKYQLTKRNTDEDSNHDYKTFEHWCLISEYCKGLFLDRIDNNGFYSPDNCRIVTQHQSAQNKRNNHFMPIDGYQVSMSEWARIHGLKRETVKERLRNGWTLLEISSIPLGMKRSQWFVWFYGLMLIGLLLIKLDVYDPISCGNNLWCIMQAEMYDPFIMLLFPLSWLFMICGFLEPKRKKVV